MVGQSIKQETEDYVFYDLGWAQATVIGLSISSLDYLKGNWVEYAKNIGWIIARMNGNKWALGDAYIAGEIVFRNRDATQTMPDTKIKIKTIQNYAWVCRRYPFSERMYPPSFSHHAIVAKLNPERRRYWLLRVLLEDLKCEDLTELTAEERGAFDDPRTAYRSLVRSYNQGIKAWRKLPSIPEKFMLERAFKTLEHILEKIDNRLRELRQKAA